MVGGQLAATLFSALGLFFVAISTTLQYRESRKSRQLTEYSLTTDLSDRIWNQVPQLAEVLSLPDDIVNRSERSTFVGFFLTYAQAWQAAELGLFRDAGWNGLRSEFAYWAQQPKATDAMVQFQRSGEGWPADFFDFVASEVETFRDAGGTRDRRRNPPLS